MTPKGGQTSTLAGRRRQQVTIRHVAADAGVSLQTVSRVINNAPNVRPEVKQRVQSSIDKLGYVPSIAAQRLSGSRSYLILALNDRDRTIADWRERQGADWVDQMLLGGMLKVAEYGYRLMFELVDTHDDHVERELRATLAALQPDGVILTPPHSENVQITSLLQEVGIAFARIGSVQPGAGVALSMDEEEAAAMATRHLADLGHKRIGFISGAPEYSLSNRRVSGWQGEMKRRGLAVKGMLAKGDFSFESGVSATKALLDLKEPVTAIIASNDRMALGALAVAHERGLEIPSNLSLLSFDNTPVVRFTGPPLTAVDQPVADLAALAVEMIIRVLRKQEIPHQPLIVEAGLVKRSSTAPPRAA
ncbi:LacI family DNA-binding transcriptional regulator [Sphingomonas limnosediminicola]|uniref:LacI family DNA-binding transcriptional regulator n=1 Tax=Sphingomonas limnosediminicola TaxID=940133 RepID=A0ABP7LIP2_9SPHN